MVRTIALGLLAAAAAGCGFADVAGDARRGSVTRVEIASAALDDTIPIHVYLPPGAGRNGERLPVIYLLHGYGGNEHIWFSSGRAHETADRLMAGGDIPRAILVTTWGGRYFYVNSPVGRWSDFVSDELPRWVEARYPARTDRGGRLLVGNSMGGWGALYNGLTRPERFAAIAALSGILDTSDWSGKERLQPIDYLRAAPRDAPIPPLYADCGT
ncbi:MAG: alpha/beta hydrolase, partial [Planctomycetota bacterium]